MDFVVCLCSIVFFDFASSLLNFKFSVVVRISLGQELDRKLFHRRIVLNLKAPSNRVKIKKSKNVLHQCLPADG